MTADTTLWGTIEGVEIRFPMVVEELHQATLIYTVPIEPARELVPGEAFEVVEIAPGSAMFMMALVDYVRNPWGDYNEVNLGLLVHPVGRPEAAGAFVYRMPVDQEFTRRAGNEVLGLPKVTEQLQVTYDSQSVRFELREGGRHALTVALPRVPTGAPVPTDTVTYSYLDGTPTELPLSIELGSGTIDPGDVQVELGDTALADELRTLGLPRPPDSAVWGEELCGTFWAPRPI